MDVWEHIVVSSFVAALIYPFLGTASLLVLVGGVLIDVDHYIWYILIKKDWSLVRCHRHCEHMRPFNCLHVFHTVEVFVALLLLAFYYSLFIPVLLGFVVHQVMDFIYMKRVGQKGARAASLFYWIYAVLVKKTAFTA